MLTIDRNARARLLFQAEALDRRTHQPGQHGGCLKRTGLTVLRALLFTFANLVTGAAIRVTTPCPGRPGCPVQRWPRP